MGNDFDEDTIGTITSDLHERELDVDRIRTVADEYQKQKVLMCDVGEFVFSILARCRGRMMAL